MKILSQVHIFIIIFNVKFCFFYHPRNFKLQTNNIKDKCFYSYTKKYIDIFIYYGISISRRRKVSKVIVKFRFPRNITKQARVARKYLGSALNNKSYPTRHLGESNANGGMATLQRNLNKARQGELPFISILQRLRHVKVRASTA